MKKIKIFSFSSLDGFIAKNDGDIGWIMRHTEGKDYGFSAFRASVDTVLINEPQYLNIQSYDIAWPYTGLQCWVVSPSHFTAPEERLVHILLDYPHDEILARLQYDSLQQLPGDGDIWLAGDHRLIATMMQYELVDEINLVALPEYLNAGYKLPFDPINDESWESKDAEHYSEGIVAFKYVRLSQ